MTAKQLPAFPKERDFAAIVFENGRYAMGRMDAYNKAIAAYWEARLREAFDTLEAISDHSFCAESRTLARKALALIGELPDAKEPPALPHAEREA
jgi:hypothetical protein